MVKYQNEIDTIFYALSDSTRRDILKRSFETEQSISALSKCYDMSFVAVAKHINVLAKAELLVKFKVWREQKIRANIMAVEKIQAVLDGFESLWKHRLSHLDDFFAENFIIGK